MFGNRAVVVHHFIGKLQLLECQLKLTRLVKIPAQGVPDMSVRGIELHRLPNVLIRLVQIDIALQVGIADEVPGLGVFGVVL